MVAWMCVEEITCPVAVDGDDYIRSIVFSSFLHKMGKYGITVDY
jgi:hypothetical protein